MNRNPILNFEKMRSCEEISYKLNEIYTCEFSSFTIKCMKGPARLSYI